MGAFFKEHSYNMVKLFVNQIGLTVFGTMLTLATVTNKPLLLAASIFSILFYLVINYTAVWEIGAADKIRIDGGRLAPMPAKGIYLAIGAAIPNIVLTLLIGIGILLDTAAGQGISMICNIIVRLLNGMYLGVIDTVEALIFADTATLADIWWWFFIINLPAIFTAGLAYFLGSKNIRIAGIFGIKPKASGGEKKN